MLEGAGSIGQSVLNRLMPNVLLSHPPFLQGMLEGAGSIGQSVLRGFKGLISQPVQGAKKQGAVGAVKGIGKGLLGAVASPMSGVLDALSATAEGFDATFGKPKEQLLVMERRRPPRLVSGDGKLLPLVRGGSTKQSRIEEIGQALLRNTLLAAPDGLRRMQQGGITGGIGWMHHRRGFMACTVHAGCCLSAMLIGTPVGLQQ
jgi:hypothetical protein